MPRTPTPRIEHIRRYAVGRTLFGPTTLLAAIERLGFVQADPIRAPARAQDLILRHRVKDYRAGDLEARYARLPIEEDAFVNYGYLPRATAALMHPRAARQSWTAERQAMAAEVIEFVRERGTVHPDDVDAHFQHGTATNWFGGSSRVSTQLLDAMHHRGLLRVAGRRSGTRTYALTAHGLADETDPADGYDRLVDVAMQLYAPLPTRTLRMLVRMIRYGAPQWGAGWKAAAQRALTRYESATVDGITYHWPADEDPTARRWTPTPTVRLLAPFDPIVWDRERFGHLWGWEYRFEAYTPAPKRLRGYYSLPLLWGDDVIGWANLKVVDGRLVPELGYVSAAPSDPAYGAALAAELDRMAAFLKLNEIQVGGPGSSVAQ